MTKPWDADASKPGAPTSLDVLIRWLLIPGKYQSWQSGNKPPLLQEIVNELKKQGTSKRSPAAIRRQMFKLEHQYEAASNWLKTEGKLEEYLRGGQVDENVERSVLLQCPMYRELTLVYQTASGSGVNSDKVEQDAENDNKISDARADVESKPADPPESVRGKHNRSSTEPEVAGVDSSAAKSGHQEALVLEEDQVMEETVASHSAQVSDDGNQALEEFHRGSEHRWNQYHGVTCTSYLGRIEGEMARQSFDREEEHAKALAELRFEAEKKRQEVRTNCENTLLRHKLRSAGVSEDQVASSVPE